MNKKLEYKKMQAELMRVQAAKIEMEYRIEEKLDEINRLKDNIDIQIKKENELINILTNMKEV